MHVPMAQPIGEEFYRKYPNNVFLQEAMSRMAQVEWRKISTTLRIGERQHPEVDPAPQVRCRAGLIVNADFRGSPLQSFHSDIPLEAFEGSSRVEKEGNFTREGP